MLGRRGPAQAAFTNPELLELGELARADVIVRPGRGRSSTSTARRWLESEDATATARRNVELLREYAQREPAQASRTGSSCASCARRSRSLGDEHGAVTGLRVARNRIEPRPGRQLRAVRDRRGGGRSTAAWCMRSIGYRGAPLPASRSTSAAA